VKERTGSDLPAHSRKIAALAVLGGASLTVGVYLATLAHLRLSSRPVARCPAGSICPYHGTIVGQLAHRGPMTKWPSMARAIAFFYLPALLPTRPGRRNGTPVWSGSAGGPGASGRNGDMEATSTLILSCGRGTRPGRRNGTPVWSGSAGGHGASGRGRVVSAWARQSAEWDSVLGARRSTVDACSTRHRRVWLCTAGRGDGRWCAKWRGRWSRWWGCATENSEGGDFSWVCRQIRACTLFHLSALPRHPGNKARTRGLPTRQQPNP